MSSPTKGADSVDTTASSLGLKGASSPSQPSSLNAGPKARTGSASSGGGASRVRAAASMWENNNSSPPAPKAGRPGEPGKLRTNAFGKTTASSAGRVTPSARSGATRSNSSSSTRTTTSPSSTKRTPLSPKLSSPNSRASSDKGNGFAPSSFKSINSEIERPPATATTPSPRSATPPLPTTTSPVPPVPSLSKLSPSKSPQAAEDELPLPAREPTPPPPATPEYSPVSAKSTLLPAATISPATAPISLAAEPASPVADLAADLEPISLADPITIVEKERAVVVDDEGTVNDGVADKIEDYDEVTLDDKMDEVNLDDKLDEAKSDKKFKGKARTDISDSSSDDLIDKRATEASKRLSPVAGLGITPVESEKRVDAAIESALKSAPEPQVSSKLSAPSSGLLSYIPLSRETSPAQPSRSPVAGVTSLFSRVLPPSPTASFFPTSAASTSPAATTAAVPSAPVLASVATPPRGSSAGHGHDEIAPVPSEQWAPAGGKGAEPPSASIKAPSSATSSLTPAPTPTGKSRFFSSATSAFSNLQLPSVTLPSLPTTAVLQSRPTTGADTSPPNEPSSSSHLTPATSPGLAASPGSSWRTTMTHFLQRTQPQPPSTPPPVTSAPTSRNGSMSTVARVDSSSDHMHQLRESEQEPLSEGFERVRNEMEVAAREIRRERAGRGISLGTDESVDWTFWGAVVQDYEDVANTRPKELSRAIQQGIPAVIRGPIWQLMSSSKSANLEETYKALLKQTTPSEKAIQKDINRTLPSHKFFQGAVGQDSLYSVCKAYSLYDPDVGYTQGLAFIVATLLLNMPDEEAFCVLVRLMSSYNLRSHYLDDMPGLQLRLFQFDRLVEEILPLLHNHLVRKGIKSSMYASQWLMTLFSYRFPLSLVYRVVDIVLAEGTEAVFRFALALLKKCEDQLLGLEFEELLAFLTGDLYECYRAEPVDGEEQWRTNDFVRDAYEIRITPLMLDQFEVEWSEKCRAQTEHLRQLEAYARETEQLRGANRHLSSQVKTLEASIATMNQEHVELVRQLVLAKIAKEDMETELVKYKAMCAALAQGREDDVDLPTIASRGSANSLTALAPSRRGSGLPTPSNLSPHQSPGGSQSGRVSPHLLAGRVSPGLGGRANE